MPELLSGKMQRWLMSAWVFALVLALFPFTADPASPPKELLTTVVVVLLGALAVWRGYVARKPMPVDAPASLLLLALLAVLVITGGLSEWPENSLFALYRWVPLALVTLYAAQIYRDAGQAWRLAAVMVAAAGVSSLYGMLQYSGLDFFPWAATNLEEYRGLPSTYGNPNFAGHALVLAMILAAGLLVEKRYWWCGVALVLMGGHLYLTHMRGGPLALAGAATLCLIAWGVSRLRMRHPTHFTLLFLVLSAMLGVGALGALQHARVGHAGTVDSSITLRLNGYAGAARMILERPATGFGLGNYATEAPRYWTAFEQAWYARTGQRNANVHNEFLEMAVDAGFAGALVYIALLCYAIIAGLHMYFFSAEAESRRWGLTLSACFLAFAIDGCFGFNAHVPVSAGFFFLLLGVLEGVRGPAAGRRHGGVVVAVSLLLLGSTALMQTTRYFAAEVHFQRASGALRYLGEHGDLDEPSKNRILEFGAVRLEDAHRLLPWPARYSEALGGFALEQRQFERAILHFEAALRAQPYDAGLMLQSAQAHVNLALASSVASADPEAARTLVELAAAQAHRALAVCNDLAEAEETLGRCATMRATLLAQDATELDACWADAEQHFAGALRRGADAPGKILQLLAQARLNRGGLDGAAESLRNAVEVSPEDTQIWPLYDRYVQAGGAPATRTAALNHALDLLRRQPAPPADAVAEIEGRLGRHYLEIEQSGIAAALFRDAVKLAPARLDLWRGFALSHPAATRLSATVEYFGQIDPARLPEVLHVLQGLETAPAPDCVARAQQIADLAQALAEAKTPEGVDADAGWLADLFLGALEQRTLPELERGQVMTCLGAVLLDAGRAAAADEVLTRAAAALPAEEQGVVLMLRSRALQALGQSQPALDFAREAVRIAPRRMIIRWHLARLLAASDLLAEANLEYLALLSQAGSNTAEYGELHREQSSVQAKLETARREEHP